MTNKFIAYATSYLAAIDMPAPLRERVKTIYEFYRKIIPDEITDVFVTDYLNKDGTRVYENLWFFSETYCMEAKQFITKDDFDITPIKVRMRYVRIQKEDYDFKKATEKSKVNLYFGLETGVTGDLKASNENCDYLKDTFLKHFTPNLMK